MEMDALWEPAKGTQACWHLDFNPVTSILDSWPPELYHIKICVVLNHYICGNLLQQQEDMNLPVKTWLMSFKHFPFALLLALHVQWIAFYIGVGLKSQHINEKYVDRN